MNKDLHISSAISSLTMEVLRKYAEGKLSREENVRVEKLLENDPFAADALEGYQSLKNPELLATLTPTIQEETRQLVARKRFKKFISLSVRHYVTAAAVFLVIWLSYFVYHQAEVQIRRTIPQTPTTAQVEKPAQPEVSQQTPTAGDANVPSAPIAILQTENKSKEVKKATEVAKTTTVLQQEVKTPPLLAEKNYSEDKPLDKKDLAMAIDKEAPAPPVAVTETPQTLVYHNLPAAPEPKPAAIPMQNTAVQPAKEEVADMLADKAENENLSYDDDKISEAQVITSKKNPKRTKTTAPNTAKPKAEDIHRPDLIYPQGVELFAAEKYKDAMQMFKNVPLFSPYFTESQLYIGKCHYFLHQYNDAIKVLKEVATSASPDIQSDANWYLAQSYLKKGDQQNAAPILEKLSKDAKSGQQKGK